MAYALIFSLFIDLPTYRYLKKHRLDIFKGAFVQFPAHDSFKFIAYVFSEIANEDDRDEVLLKRYGRINVIIGFVMMVSGLIYIGFM